MYFKELTSLIPIIPSVSTKSMIWIIKIRDNLYVAVFLKSILITLFILQQILTKVNIIFRNIIYNGVGENPSLLKGFDKERSVKNIIFDNVIINGMKMKNIDDFITNEYIKNITVK